ncbi:MAG: YdbH domain-containing protein [Planctomycetaceae bacterium]|nr:YdbH domain-containing protein [Planctomycetaceae bacterium]
MKRKRRWIGRIIVTVGVVSFIVIGLWLWLGTAIIEHVVAAQVEGLGLPRPSLRIGGNSLSHLEINDLSVGQNDRLSVDSVGIDYTVRQLLHKRVDSVEIVGFNAEIRRKDGVWDLGPLADLHGPTGGETATEIPFGRITLRASSLVLDLDGRRLRIPISGSLENTDPEAVALDLTAVVEGAALQFAGTFNSGSGEFNLALSGDVPNIGPILTALAPSLPIAISAGTTGRLASVRSSIEGTWDARGRALAGSLSINGINASFEHKFGDHPVTAGVRDGSLFVKLQKDFAAGRKPGSPLMIEFVADTPPESRGLWANMAGIDMTAPRAEIRGTAVLDGGPAVVSARVSLADALVGHKGMELAISGLEADIPLSWNAAAAPEPGRLAAKSVKLKGASLPSLSGTLSLADTRAEFAMVWEPLPGARLRVEGSASLGIGAGGPSARAYVSLPLFEIADANALGRLVPPLDGLLAGGSFGLDGYVRLTPDGLVPNIALTVLDGSFKSKAWDAHAEGVFATVRINSFTPLLTPRKELQVALVRHAAIGKLDLKDGFMAFRLEPKEVSGAPTGWSAYVQRGECGWVGGRLYVDSFRFDPEAKEHAVTVFARDLKMADLLALIPDHRATGVGSLDGQLNVTVGTLPDIQFGGGELRTLPGQAGWFKVKDAEVLGSVLDSTDLRFQTDTLYMEIKKRLINAFKDFEYDELSVVLTTDGDRPVARIFTKGRARTGQRQEFEDVTLNFFDFDKTLRDVIIISRGIQKLK